jgi:hypothetical protein
LRLAIGERASCRGGLSDIMLGLEEREQANADGRRQKN